jgi:hypothetical protein
MSSDNIVDHSWETEGHPEYGCFISKAKTLTNFDFDAEIMNVTQPQQRREYLLFIYSRL